MPPSSPLRLPVLAFVLRARAGKAETKSAWPEDGAHSWAALQLQDLASESPETHAAAQRCLALQLLVRARARWPAVARGFPQL